MLEAVRRERTDQASGLRKLFPARGLRVLPVASALEKRRPLTDLAAGFAAAGQQVLILDHDWSAQRAQRGGSDLAAVLRGTARFEAAAVPRSDQVRQLAVGTGFSVMNEMGITAEDFFGALRKLERPADMVMVATSDARAVAQLLGGQGEFLLLAGATAAGVANTYRLLKSITSRGLRVRLVFEGVDHRTAAEHAFRRIETTATRFLGVFPMLAGWLPRESHTTNTRTAGTGAGREALQSIASAALQWDLAEFPRAREAGQMPSPAASDLRGVLVERSSPSPLEARGYAGRTGGDAPVEPARSVRRARTRREW